MLIGSLVVAGLVASWSSAWAASSKVEHEEGCAPVEICERADASFPEPLPAAPSPAPAPARSPLSCDGLSCIPFGTPPAHQAAFDASSQPLALIAVPVLPQIPVHGIMFLDSPLPREAAGRRIERPPRLSPH